MNLVDVHCHLESERFSKDLDEVIKRAKENGIKIIINSGVNPSTNRKCLEISKKYDIVFSSFGIYPIDGIAEKLGDFSEEEDLRHIESFDVDKEIEWIRKNKENCVAIGEIGLDFSLINNYKDEQKEIFTKLLDLALEIEKPVIIHSRKAEIEAIEILEKYQNLKVIMHCFNGNKNLIKRGVQNGFFFSVPPVITRLQHFRTLVEIVPIEQILTETDAPYLSSIKGNRNEPSEVLVTIREIAKIKNLSEEEVAKKVFDNATKIFKK